MNEPVELHTALMFDCPECGLENFVRLAHPTLDDAEIDEMCEERGIPNDGNWMFAIHPEEVTCQFCKKTFPTIVG